MIHAAATGIVENPTQSGVVFLREGINDRQAKIVLAAKVMVERPLGHTGRGQYGIDARRAKAFMANQIGAGMNDMSAGVLRCHVWYTEPFV
jgi:hypothetical protein